MGGSLEAFKLFNQRYSTKPTQSASAEANTTSDETPLHLRQKMAADAAAAAASSDSSSVNDSADAAAASSPATSTSSVDAKEQVEDTRTEMQKRVATLYGDGRKGGESVGSLR